MSNDNDLSRLCVDVEGQSVKDVEMTESFGNVLVARPVQQGSLDVK